MRFADALAQPGFGAIAEFKRRSPSAGDISPGARVEHKYEFAKGHYKWRMLERNRWAMIIRTYPTSLLVLIAPALAGAELAVWATAIRGGSAEEVRTRPGLFSLGLPITGAEVLVRDAPTGSIVL